MFRFSFSSSSFPCFFPSKFFSLTLFRRFDIVSLSSLCLFHHSRSLSRMHSLFQTLLIFFFPSLLLSLSSPKFPPLSPISSLIYFPFSTKLNLHSFISESSSSSHPFSHVRPNIPLNFSLIIILLSSLSLRPHVFSVIALFSSIPSLPPNSLFLLHFNLSFYRPLFRLSRNRNFSLSCIFFLSLSLSHGLSHFLTSSPSFTPSTTTPTHLASLFLPLLFPSTSSQKSFSFAFSLFLPVSQPLTLTLSIFRRSFSHFLLFSLFSFLPFKLSLVPLSLSLPFLRQSLSPVLL